MVAVAAAGSAALLARRLRLASRPRSVAAANSRGCALHAVFHVGRVAAAGFAGLGDAVLLQLLEEQPARGAE